jgi:predicted dehydrogenase
LRAAGFEVAGLVGTDADRTRQRAESNHIALAFTDLDEAITRTGAKVVTVATPPNTHAPLSMSAISRGCHVLCEKPLAANAMEARAMLEAAQRAGIVHLVGFEFRWSPERALLARAVAEGLIGVPRLALLVQYMALVASSETRMPPWWFDEQAGGGWLGAHGSHIVDQVRTLLGEFESVSATLPTVSAREGVAEDSYSVRFRMVNGVEGILQHSAGGWGPVTGMTRVAGTRGTLWIENGIVKMADHNGTRDLPVPDDLALPVLPAASTPGALPASPAALASPAPATPPEGAAALAAGRAAGDHRPRPGIDLLAFTRLCEVLRAAVDGTPLPAAVPIPTFADGVACMEVLDAIRESAARNGALVRLR